MRYYARFGIGLLLGLLTAVGVGFLAEATWPVAVAGTLAGMLGFLATFFVWNPDRAPSEEEPEGYEQVLFDARNNAHLVVLLLLVAGGAYGHAFAFAGGDDGAPAVDPMAAELDEANSGLVAMVEAFNAAHSNFTAGAADAEALRAQDDAATKLRLELEALELSGAMAERRDALSEAAAFMSAAFASLASCVEQEATSCLDARVLQGEAANALSAAKTPA